MDISIVIPTYHRPKTLAECLDSIILQTSPPKEVIIVDNGSGQESEKVVQERAMGLERRRIQVKYVKNKENSGASARNLGVSLSTGELVAFLDDDVVLERDHYKAIVAVFAERAEALGVQGYNQGSENTFSRIEQSVFWGLVEAFGKISQAYSFFERDKCRVLPSLCVTYPFPSLSRTIQCEWVSTCTGVFRRKVFEEFRLDNNLKKYSWNEYLDFSYRIFKKYPNSLFTTPGAKYWHTETKEGRMPPKELIYMAEVYDLYIFFKTIDQTLRNRMIYMYGKIGRFLYNTAKAIFAYKGNLRLLWCHFHAPLFALWHVREIKKGDLEFFNRTLK